MPRLHLRQGEVDVGDGDDDDGDLQEGGDGAGKVGGEAVQHPRRFEPGDEEPGEEPGGSRSQQPGGIAQHLQGEPDQDGRVDGEGDEGGRGVELHEELGRVRTSEPDPGRTQCCQVIGWKQSLVQTKQKPHKKKQMQQTATKNIFSVSSGKRVRIDSRPKLIYFALLF